MVQKKAAKTNHKKTIKKESDLKVRLISAGVMVIILIGYLSTSILSTEAKHWELNINVTATNYVFFSLSIILTGAMGYEAIHALGIKRWWAIGTLVGTVILFFIFPFFKADADKFLIYKNWNVDGWFKWWQSLILLLIFLLIFGFIASRDKEEKVKSWLAGLKIAGVCLLIILGMKGFVELNLAMNADKPYYGFVTTIWIWLTIIATDSLAYLGGSRFGKTKLAPSISPKKTWEGAAIGTAGALLIGSLVSLLVFYLVPNHDYGPWVVPFKNLANNMGIAVPGILLVLLTLVIAIIGQTGDLLFSAVKRSVDIKDFSKLIPGHGGLLDRLDSFLLTFLVIFIIIQFV